MQIIITYKLFKYFLLSCQLISVSAFTCSQNIVFTKWEDTKTPVLNQLSTIALAYTIKTFDAKHRGVRLFHNCVNMQNSAAESKKYLDIFKYYRYRKK